MTRQRARLATGNFGKQLEAFAKNTKQSLDEAHRQIVIEMGTAIILGTPFGDPATWQRKPETGYAPGMAQSNWMTRVNGIASGTTVNRGADAAIAELRERAGLAGTVTTVTNGLVYIMRLEYEGWSRQAPAGMVRIQMAMAQQIVSGIVSGIKNRSRVG